eukprot:TRINITY_DN15146_c0_g1_i1.p1 TRINITY_DN15146_c0_g1~~TRINITY_DN15146_c0_g1_i1.p1  ORF type:complete len:290 (-),score=61.54 TRINITY_DN15146_c0_g1_i1:111-980(-)
MFKDRTREFFTLTEALRKSGVKTKVPPKASRNPATQKISINQIASEIGRETYETAQKLRELTKLAKSKSLFDDPAEKIQELTVIVKSDIHRLNQKINQLQTFVESRGRSNDQTNSHSGTIIDSLKTSLMQTTNQFREVLEVRTENLKSQQERKESVIGLNISHSPMFHTRSYTTLYEENENPDDNVTIHLPLVQTTETMIETRTNAIRTIESTIEELKSIFQNLATLVSQQAETIQRIDDNVNMTIANVDGAQKQLLHFLNKISSNRWILMKVFAVLIIFSFLFIVFFA